MTAKQERCWWRGCNAWAFNGKLCRTCASSHSDVAQSLRVDWNAYAKAPAQVPNLYIFGAPEHPVHLDVPVGTPVDVVAMCADQRTAVVRTRDGKVGYYGYYQLATEEQIYHHHQAEEARKAEEAKAAQAAAEAAKLASIEQRLAQNARDRDMHIQAQRDAERAQKEAQEAQVQAMKQQYLQQQQEQQQSMLAMMERRRAEEERISKDQHILSGAEKRWQKADAAAEQVYAQTVPEHLRREQEARLANPHEEEVRRREQELQAMLAARKQ